MDLLNRNRKKSQFIVFVSFILLILQRCFVSVLEMTPTIETILLLGLIFMSLNYNYSRYKMSSVVRIILLAIFLLFFIFVVRNAHTGIGSLQTLLLFLLYYLIAGMSFLTPKDFKNIQILSFLGLLGLTIFDVSDYNTNSIGLSFLIFSIYFSIFLSHDKKKDIVLFIIVSLFTIYSIYKSDTRTAMFAYFVYTLIRFFPSFLLKNKFVLLSFLLFFTIGNLLYVFLYITLYMKDFELPILNELSNKQLFSGRQLIWIEVLNYFYQYPFTGIGSKIHLSSHSNVNLHNSMLMFFAIYGSLIGSLVVLLICRLVLPLSDYVNNYIVKNSIAAYLTFLLIGFSETNMISMSFACIFPIYIAYSVKNNSLIIYRSFL